MTRAALAAAAAVSLSTIARMELLGHVPNAKALVRIARVLEVKVDSLLESA